MGNITFSNIFAKFLKRGKYFRILTLGFDAAGKTTFLYKLKVGEVFSTIATIGFNVETIQYHNVNFTVWDVSGRDKSKILNILTPKTIEIPFYFNNNCT